MIWTLSGGGYFWPIWVIGPWGLAIMPAALRSRHSDERVRNAKGAGRGGAG